MDNIVMGMGEQYAPPVTVTEADTQWARGWALYALGAPDSVCTTYQQQQGWWAACEADAKAQPLLDLSDVNWDDSEDWEVG